MNDFEDSEERDVLFARVLKEMKALKKLKSLDGDLKKVLRDTAHNLSENVGESQYAEYSEDWGRIGKALAKI